MPTCRRLAPQNWWLICYDNAPSPLTKFLAIRIIFSSAVLTQQPAFRSVHPLSNQSGN